ncbi:PREDICTED: olfactory receptor 5V1-like [Nanorana parkeri]|uniref:olfactory receptor 5V1-like n=1 Tax=Nanorana parkeri TaxID=125878 RepID=UPI000854052E|nr:PREDICTED: olfactory receptor 5V1-like [Nanorana parkeri]
MYTPDPGLAIAIPLPLQDIVLPLWTEVLENAKCELVVCLEAQILDLNNKLSTLQSINNMERSLDLTHQVLVESGIEEKGRVEEQDLEDVGDISSGVPLLEQDASTIRRGSDCYKCYLLAVMAFDRDLAINNPLRYSSFMTPNVCIQLSVLPWVSGFTLGLIPIIFTSSLEFCRSNEVNHFVCDLSALLSLSCSNTFWSNVVTSIITVFAGLIPFSAIMLIYIHIILTISKIKCPEGKKKAFSTCSSHLTVTSLFFGTVIIMYIRPRFTEYDKFIALIYTVVIPFLNPFIYTLRNKDVKVALMKAKF